MGEITTLDLINLIASISSIFLAIIAIVLSLVFFFGNKRTERDMTLSIGEIKNTTATLDKLSLRMLNRVTTALVTRNDSEEKIHEVIREAKKTGLLEAGDDSSDATKEELEQARVDNLIAALYYCGLTNLSSQTFLPTNIGGTENNEWVPNIVDQSKNDYEILKSWIHGSKNYDKKIDRSAVKHMYEIAISWDNEVKTTREYYASKENQPTG